MYGQKQLILATTLVASALISLQACAPNPKASTPGRLSPQQRNQLANGQNKNGQQGQLNQQQQSLNTTPVVQGNTVTPPAGLCRITDVATEDKNDYFAKEPYCESLQVTLDADSVVVLPPVKMNIAEKNAAHIFTTAEASATDGGTVYTFTSDGKSTIIALLYALPGKVDAKNITVTYNDGTINPADAMIALTRDQEYVVTIKTVTDSTGKNSQQLTAIRILPETIRTLNYTVNIVVSGKVAAAVATSKPATGAAAPAAPATSDASATVVQTGGATAQPPAQPAPPAPPTPPTPAPPATDPPATPVTE